MSKEEILEQYEPNVEYPSYYHENNVLSAMESYKDQECAELQKKCEGLVKALEEISCWNQPANQALLSQGINYLQSKADKALKQYNQ